MIPGLSSVYHWTVCNSHRSSSKARGHDTREMRVSLLQSVSWPWPFTLLSVFELPFLAKHSGKVLLPHEYPFPTFSSEISHISHGSYLSLTSRHTPLSKTARSKCHPFSFISSLSEFALVTYFSTAAEQYREHRRILHGKSISTAERLRNSLKHDSWDMQPGKLVWSMEMNGVKFSSCSLFWMTVLISGLQKRKEESDLLNYIFI